MVVFIRASFQPVVCLSSHVAAVLQELARMPRRGLHKFHPMVIVMSEIMGQDDNLFWNNMVHQWRRPQLSFRLSII